jgi:hypothetical protein
LRIDIVGPAIIGDFLGISGSEFPSDSTAVFRGSGTEVHVRPALVRPHWLLLESVPGEVPRGENDVQVVASGGWSSATTRVHVSDGEAATVRVLCPGRKTTWPFTIAIVANPAIKTENGGIVADSPTTNPVTFRTAVVAVLRQLLTLDEDLLRRDGLETLLRFVAICDGRAQPRERNALCEEYRGHPIMLPRRRAARDFLKRRSVRADVIFVIHGSPTHVLASAPFTTDDRSELGTTYTYDGEEWVHYHFPRISGAVALHVDFDRAHPIVLHEFAHAVSSDTNGKLTDAYVEGQPCGFIVNKRYRASTNDPIPRHFCSYDGVVYSADPNRDSLTYPPDWKSYHPALQDPTRPNLMDDYRMTADPSKCRFDRLTYQWLRDRLWAKARR